MINYSYYVLILHAYHNHACNLHVTHIFKC